MIEPFDYRVNTHISTRLKGVLNNATIVRDTSVLTFEDASFFPDVGRVTAIYVDASNNMAYRWNDTINKYVELNGDASASKIVVTTGIIVSDTAPLETRKLWVDISDSYFIKYFDGSLWRKSNIALLCDPDAINGNSWIVIPDNLPPIIPDNIPSDEWIDIPDTDGDDGPGIPSGAPDEWITIPDKTEDTSKVAVDEWINIPDDE